MGDERRSEAAKSRAGGSQLPHSDRCAAATATAKEGGQPADHNTCKASGCAPTPGNTATRATAEPSQDNVPDAQAVDAANEFLAGHMMSLDERKILYDSCASSAATLDSFSDMLVPHVEDGISVLSLAASGGYCDLVNILLSKANVSADDRGPKGDCTPLMEAASSGHVEIIKCLIKHGADVNAHSSVATLGNTPLIYACAAGNLDAVTVLLDAGADIDLCNDNGQSPLMEAAASGHLEVAKLLVSRGARSSFLCADLKVGLESPLTLACYKGHVEMVRFLLDNCGNCCSPGREEELHTALMEASMDGHVEVAKLLLDAGALVNLAADSFESPLTLAACGGHVELARLLLSKGARLDEINEEGFTPLMEAAREGHLEMVMLLNEHGADVNMITDDTGETAMTLAASGNFKDVVAYLVNSGADVDLGTCTPLMEAAQEGNLETVMYLADCGANVNLVTAVNETALSYAADGGHTKVCEVLLEYGAKVDIAGETGRTPLMKAAANGHKDTVEYLLQMGANPNKMNATNECTAFSLACAGGHLQTVELLLRYGADPNVRLKDGSTCIIEACRGGHTRVVEFLVDGPAACAASPITFNGYLGIPAQMPFVMKQQQQQQQQQQHKVGPAAVAEVKAGEGQMLPGPVPPPMVLPPPPFPCSAKDVQSVIDSMPWLIDAGDAGKQVAVSLVQSAAAAASALSPSAELCGAVSMESELRLAQEKLKMHLNESLSSLVNGKDVGSVVGSSTVKLKKAELDAAVKELEELKRTQKLYENLKSALVKEKESEEEVAATLVELAAVAAAAAAGGGGVTEAAAIMGSVIPETHQSMCPGCESCGSKMEVHHQHFNVVLPVMSQCTSLQQQAMGGGGGSVTKVEESVVIPCNPAVSVTMVSVMASEAASVYRNSTRFGFGTNMLSLANMPNAGAMLPPSMEMAPNGVGGGLFIPVNLNSQQQEGGGGGGSQCTQGQQFYSVNASAAAAPVAAMAGATNIPSSAATVASTTSVVTDTVTTKVAANGQQQQTSYAASANCLVQQQQQPVVFPPGYQTPNFNFMPTDGLNSWAMVKSPPVMPMRPLVQDLNCQTESTHDTALTLACAGGHEELVQLLVQRGADIEHKDKKGCTPLIVAVNNGHQGVVELLINHGANVEAQTDRTKETALSVACQIGRRDVAEVLLKHHANKEHRNVSDYTPLCLAAAGGYIEVMELLLQHGAEINSCINSKLGITPLMLASMNGNVQAVRFLIEHGADINAQIETNRNTALTLACFQGKPEVVKILVDCHANVEHRAKSGLTPLMEAASGGYVEVGHVLLQAGADPNSAPVTSSRETSLTIAADKGHCAFVDLLLRYTTQVDCRTKKGYTALWLAAHGGHLECVMSLTAAHADVDMPDNRRITPLMAAFRKGHKAVVKFLVEHVTQFPSDQDIARYMSSLQDKDRELREKCQASISIITLAKDRQAQEANKIADRLLMEIEQEQLIAESRRQARLRKKEKNRQKRLKKKAAQQQAPTEAAESAAARQQGTDSKASMSDGADQSDRSAERRPSRRAAKDADHRRLPSSRSSSRPSSDSASADDRKTEAASAVSAVQTGRNEPRLPSCTAGGGGADSHSDDADSRSSDADFIPVLSQYSRQRSSDALERKIRRRRMRRTKPTVGESTGGGGHSESSPRESTDRPSNSSGKVSAEATKTALHCQRDGGSGGEEMVMSQSRRARMAAHNHHHNRKEEPGDGTTAAVMAANSGGTTWREVRRQPHKLFVAPQAIARVIGRGGQNINAIREASGAHIEVEKQQRAQSDRLVTIKGTPDAVKMAVYMINGLINDPDSHVSSIISKVKSKDKKVLESFAVAKTFVTCTSASSGTTGSIANSVPSRGSGRTAADKSAAAASAAGFPEVSLWVPTSAPATNKPVTSNVWTGQTVGISTATTSAAACQQKANFASVLATALRGQPFAVNQKQYGGRFATMDSSSSVMYRSKGAKSQQQQQGGGDKNGGLKEWKAIGDEVSALKKNVEAPSPYVFNNSISGLGPLEVDDGRHSAQGATAPHSNPTSFVSPKAVQRPASATAAIESSWMPTSRFCVNAEPPQDMLSTTCKLAAGGEAMLDGVSYPSPIGIERRLKTSMACAADFGSLPASHVSSSAHVPSVESSASSRVSDLFQNTADCLWGVSRETVEKESTDAEWLNSLVGGFSCDWSTGANQPFDNTMRPFSMDSINGDKDVLGMGSMEQELFHRQAMVYGHGGMHGHHQLPLSTRSVHQSAVPPAACSATHHMPPPYYSPNIPPPSVMSTRMKSAAGGAGTGGGYMGAMPFPGDQMSSSSVGRNMPLGYGFAPPPSAAAAAHMMTNRPPPHVPINQDLWAGGPSSRRFPAPAIGDWKVNNGPLIHSGGQAPPPPHATAGGAAGWGGWNALSM